MVKQVFKAFILKFIILALCIGTGVAAASDLEDAVSAMRSGDFAEAYCIMRPLADEGDADAQYNIGWMYLNGYGLRVNDSLALQWWSKASDQGHTDASFSIGMLYSLGDGEVPKDSEKAIDYYLVAAADGHEDAVSILKSMMLRNDRFISGRIKLILSEHAALFGIERTVKASKLNVRSEASTESAVVGSLVEGDSVLEMERQGNWSLVALLGQPEMDRLAWVYNPLLND